MASQGTRVTVTIPENASPGTLLSVPVKAGAEQLKVRVPDGLGPGSTLILTQPEDSDEWSMEVGLVRPPQEASLDSAGAGLCLEEPPAPSLDVAVAYTVRLATTVGTIDIIVRPDWAPNGTRRFLELAASGDLSDLAFYRAIKGCIAQFGLPAKRPWPPIPDDPPTGVPFLLGAVSFAAVGENSRKSTLFICIGDMSHMLGQNSWETPIGAVAESSLDVLERIETMYGDIAEFGGSGPDTNRINNEGTAYLASHFPMLTYIQSAEALDWQGEADVPPLADGSEDQIALALQAAQEAQLQAQQASRAAVEAALAEHVSQAAEAARVAEHAAQVAQAAAAAARAAQEQQWQQQQPSDLSASLRARPQAPGPIDVPVELGPPSKMAGQARPKALAGFVPRPGPPSQAGVMLPPGYGHGHGRGHSYSPLAPVVPAPQAFLGPGAGTFRSSTTVIPARRQLSPPAPAGLRGHSPLVINR